MKKFSKYKYIWSILTLILALIMHFLFFSINCNDDNSSNNFAIKYAFAVDEGTTQKLTDNFTLIKYDPTLFDSGETVEVYIMVNFVSYTDSNGNFKTFTDAQKQRIKRNFNDTTDDNTLSMHEYFLAQSRGRLSVWALFLEHTTTHPESYFNFTCNTAEKSALSYQHECGIFLDAVRERNVVENNAPFTFNGNDISEFVCRINFFAGDATDTNSSFWPKNWVTYDENYDIDTKGLILYTQKVQGTEWHFYVGVICHELTHLMGVCDYYTATTNFKPVGEWDLMATTDYDNPQTLSPYFRQITGWFNESHYYDNIASEIENITSSGTYTINHSASDSGVIGYKFGYKDTNGNIEYFMIELKYSNSSIVKNVKNDYYRYPTRLLVYRVNESVKRGNLYSSTPEASNLYVFRNNDIATEWQYAGIVTQSDKKNNNLITSFGSTNDEDVNIIKYADGTNSKIVISNLSFDSTNKTMTFDIDFAVESYSINGVITKDNTPYSNVDVFVNGTKATTTDENGYYYCTNLSQNDYITFMSNDGLDITQTYTVTGDMPSSNFNVVSVADLSVKIKYGLLSLSNVVVYVDGEEKGTTDLLGSLTIPNVTLNSILTFYHSRYDFNPSSLKFADANITSFDILASLAQRQLTIKVLINNLPLNDVEIYKGDSLIEMTNNQGIANINATIDDRFTLVKRDYEFDHSSIQFTTVENVNFNIVANYTGSVNEYNFHCIIYDYDSENTIENDTVAFKLNGQSLDSTDYYYNYGDFYFSTNAGDIFAIILNGYENFEYTILSSDLSNNFNDVKKEIGLRKFVNHTFLIVDTHNNILSNVNVYRNNALIGETNQEGQINGDFLTNDEIKCSLYQYDDLTLSFDALNPQVNIIMTPEIVQINITIKTYDGLIFTPTNLGIKNGNTIITYSVENDKFIFEARYLDTIEFTLDGYKIENLVVDFASTDYEVVAKKYISISGTINYKNNELLNLIFSIKIGDEIIGYTDSNCQFEVSNVLEGSILIFETFGFSSQGIEINSGNYVDMKVDVEFSIMRVKSLLPAYIVFAFFALLLFISIVGKGVDKREKTHIK